MWLGLGGVVDGDFGCARIGQQVGHLGLHFFVPGFELFFGFGEVGALVAFEGENGSLAAFEL
ncbi:MAG: hypothetical protein RIS92_2361 [Verrucomicrobiota bacterium]